MKRYNDILLFCFALIIGLSLWPELSLGSTEVRILSSSERSISFEIVVPPHHIAPADEGRIRIVLPGYGTFSPPGAIELPGKTFRVAIPPSGSPQVTTSILEEVPLGPLRIARVPAERLVEGENGIPATERYYPPDPWGEGEVPPVVSAEEPRFLGRQRVLPIKVNPTILAETGVRLVRRLSVTVTYGGEPVRREIEPPYLPPISRTWERLYEKLLVNPDGVSKFRKPLLPRRSLEGPSAEGERLRIYIPETGLYAVRADSLIAVGLSPGLSTGQLALKKLYFDNGEPDLLREVDIPILVLEGSSTVPNLFDRKRLNDLRRPIRRLVLEERHSIHVMEWPNPL